VRSSPGLNEALRKSFVSFGMEFSEKITLGDTKLIIIPMLDTSDYGISVGLLFADTALSIFNKKVFLAKARLLAWNRQEGRAIGAVYKSGVWTPIEEPASGVGPFLIQAPPYCFWDWFLGQS
ncbi:hypothetical protein, partial [Pseudomonas gingeri]